LLTNRKFVRLVEDRRKKKEKNRRVSADSAVGFLREELYHEEH
jgi:hypothetical protein